MFDRRHQRPGTIVDDGDMVVLRHHWADVRDIYEETPRPVAERNSVRMDAVSRTAANSVAGASSGAEVAVQLVCTASSAVVDGYLVDRCWRGVEEARLPRARNRDRPCGVSSGHFEPKPWLPQRDKSRPSCERCQEKQILLCCRLREDHPPTTLVYTD